MWPCLCVLYRDSCFNADAAISLIFELMCQMARVQFVCTRSHWKTNIFMYAKCLIELFKWILCHCLNTHHCTRESWVNCLATTERYYNLFFQSAKRYCVFIFIFSEYGVCVCNTDKILRSYFTEKHADSHCFFMNSSRLCFFFCIKQLRQCLRARETNFSMQETAHNFHLILFISIFFCSLLYEIASIFSRHKAHTERETKRKGKRLSEKCMDSLINCKHL